MKKGNQLKGFYWEYYKSLVMRKAFWGGIATLIVVTILYFIFLFPSAKDVRLEAARIISAGIYESQGSPKSRYKVEALSKDIYFIIENSNKGIRNIDQIVCLEISTLRITGSQVATITLNHLCPETAK